MMMHTTNLTNTTKVAKVHTIQHIQSITMIDAMGKKRLIHAQKMSA
jgi:hypothetical protein